MINIQGEFKGFGTELNASVEATGRSEEIVTGFLIGLALTALGGIVGYGVATMRQLRPSAKPTSNDPTRSECLLHP